jgi:two-component system NarL family sensor kinase
MWHSTAEVDSDEPDSGQPPYLPARANAQILRRLVAGFIVILALLGLDGIAGFWGERAVRDGLSALSREMAEIETFKQAYAALHAVELRILARPTTATAGQLRSDLLGADVRFKALFARVPPNSPDIAEWNDLQSALWATVVEIRRVLVAPARPVDIYRLMAAHEALSLQMQRLTRSSNKRMEATQRGIEAAAQRQSIEDRVLLAVCVLVSSLFLCTSTRIYYRMGQQSEELNQVSWQLLEKQELLAQRLSRELHHELGQSLTALKANFSRHTVAGCVDPAWMADCAGLLKESIRSAHEISHLLRPTLLDDFGLDSALSWLCERFEERNGIRVRYHSDYHWRLDDQAETHVFRIAQEALTNVSRHAKASVVDVLFSKQYGLVRLKISDNGVGMQPRPVGCLPPLGLTGMKARARSLDGKINIHSVPAQGVAVELTFIVKPRS